MDFAAGSGVVAATVEDVVMEDGVSVLNEAVVVDGVVVAVEGEVVDFSVGRKWGLVYSLNFGNLFNRFAGLSLNDLLVKPLPSCTSPFILKLSSPSNSS